MICSSSINSAHNDILLIVLIMICSSPINSALDGNNNNKNKSFYSHTQ